MIRKSARNDPSAGQISPPSHFEKPLPKAIEDYKSNEYKKGYVDGYTTAMRDGCGISTYHNREKAGSEADR